MKVKEDIAGTPINFRGHYEILLDLLLKNDSLSGGFMKNEDYVPNVARKAVALEIAKNNFDLPYAERDKEARQAEFEFVNATRALMDYEEWEKRQALDPGTKTREEHLLDLISGRQNKEPKESKLYCGICPKKCKNRVHDGKACRGFELKPKTRDEMKEFFTDAFREFPFITPDITDSITDVFLICQEEPKPAPESEKVLTTAEWTDKNIPSNFHRDIHEFIEKACEFFQQNGRLERDLELRPLVEAVERCQRSVSTGEMGIATINLFNVLGNLKPLKAE